MPEKDIQHLLEGIAAGGAVVSVAALSDQAETVEDIFHKYASKIDEVDLDNAAPPAGQDVFLCAGDPAEITAAQARVMTRLPAIYPLARSIPQPQRISMALQPPPGNIGPKEQPWHDTDAWRADVAKELEKAMADYQNRDILKGSTKASRTLMRTSLCSRRKPQAQLS